MSYYNNSYSSGPPPPPQLPPPWIAEWDSRDNRYVFLNRETGERQWNPPQQQYGGNPGYDGGYGGGYGGSSYGGPGPANYGDPRTYEQEPVREEKKSHGWMGAALGAAAGLAGGAFLMHEGHEVKEDYEEDKYKVDEFGNRIENNVEAFPENAAEWTGRKVGEVEDIPQDVEQGFDRFGNRVEQGWDNTVDDVEDAPENVANWAGDKVGDVERYGDDVERYGDRVDDAYDDGRNEGRYDD